MPFTNLPITDSLNQQLRGFDTRLAALENPARYVIANPTVAGGGATVALLGVIPNTNPPQYGLAVYDESGNVRVQAGLLANGDFGISISDLLGNTQELLPTVDSYVDGTLTTTSTSYTSLSGSPSVTVDIGASGNAKITTGAFIGVAAATQGSCALVVDGGSPSTEVISLSCSTTAGIGADIYSTRILKTWTSGPGLLTPGSHTFTLVYKTNNGSVSFTRNYLEVQPL